MAQVYSLVYLSCFAYNKKIKKVLSSLSAILVLVMSVYKKSLKGRFAAMKFYSYEYLVRRNITMDKVHLLILGIVFAVLIFSLVRYYRNKRDTRYRELALIALFCMVFLGLSQLNKAIDLKNTSKQSLAVLKSVEHIAKGLHVETKDVYINTTLMKGEPLINVNGFFYRVILINDSDYVLEPINLMSSNISLIEE